VVDPTVVDPARTALAMAGRVLDHSTLHRHVRHAADRLTAMVAETPPGHERPPLVAVPAVARAETVVAVLAGLHAGVGVVPVNVDAGEAEIRHVVDDARPLAVVGAPIDPRTAFAGLPHLMLDLDAVPDAATTHHRAPRHHEGPALVVYTSGTTGPPKGVVLSSRALAADLDALARAWRLRETDVLVHSLPLFHVHGLVLATLGPLRVGATVRHLGRFEPAAVSEAFAHGGTVFYGVPTMYHRLADAVETQPTLAEPLANARLLVSGSAGLPAHDRVRVTTATGRPVLERYGMTETLITCAMTVDGTAEPGSVGPPLPGVELRLIDDDDRLVPSDDTATIGEIQVRGATLFDGYLGRPDATQAAFTDDGWFRTGDLATWSPTGAVRIAGRRSVDLIKSGGYRIGAGEVENALLSHPDVAEVAVTGQPDADLGERVVAWVVPVAGSDPDPTDLADHVGRALARHKRPRALHLVDRLPRNPLGKVLKASLTEPPTEG
jgi:malonyl-CoA/methylmalonyl-CoA synthetase